MPARRSGDERQADVVLLLPALPRTHHAAPWLADWACQGETTLRGYQTWAIEQRSVVSSLASASISRIQRMTDRHALMPVIVVLTGDKSDCIVAERFTLRHAATLDKHEQAVIWDRTKALLKQAGARLNETPQGYVPLTALPSLPPSFSLVQLPPVPSPSPASSPSSETEPAPAAADYRYHLPSLISNINLRRLGFGGRAGFRLPAPSSSSTKYAGSSAAGATPAQQLHFLQAYSLPVPPPNTFSASSARRARDFTSTVLALGRTVQHALALFGLGPVKTYLANSVALVVRDRLELAHGGGPGGGVALTRETLERALLEALLVDPRERDGPTQGNGGGGTSRPPSREIELELEDWAEALGLPLPSTSPAPVPSSSSVQPLPPPEPILGPTLLEGDGLICDTTVAALSAFRLAYAAPFVVPSSSSSSSSPFSRTGGPGALAEDGAILPPALLAALLSLVVASRGKMVSLGLDGHGHGQHQHGSRRRPHLSGEAKAGERENVPKDAIAKRERFLRCVEAFQRAHAPAFSSTSAHLATACPPVLTPGFLATLSDMYHGRTSPSTHPQHPATKRVRGALSSALGLNGPDGDAPQTDGAETTPAHSDNEAEEAGPGRSLARRKPHLHLPHVSLALHLPFTTRSRGARGEESETLDLDEFVRGVVRGEGASGHASEGPDGGGGGDGGEEGESRRRRVVRRATGRKRRGARTASGRAGRSVRALWDPEDEGDGPLGVDDVERGKAPAAIAEDDVLREREDGAESAATATDAESVYTARTALSGRGAGLQPLTSTGAGPVSFGRGVLRGVKERAERAGRKLGLEGDDEEKAPGPPGIVVSHSRERPSSPARSPPSSLAPPPAQPPVAPSSSKKHARLALDPLNTRDLIPPAAALRSSGSPTSPGGGGTRGNRLRSPLSVSLSRSGSSSAAEGAASDGLAPLHVPVVSPASAAARGVKPANAAAAVRAETGRLAPPMMRRAVSEVPRPVSWGGFESSGSGVDEDEEGAAALRRSALFGHGGPGDLEFAGGSDGEGSDGAIRDDEDELDDDEGDEQVVFDPARRASRPDPSATLRHRRSSSHYRHLAMSHPRRRVRRHSVNLVQDAPEPIVWLSRRTLEVDVNLRTTAWRLRMKEKKLEEMVSAMEAIHRSYEQAISSLSNPLKRKTNELDSLAAAASSLTSRLERFSGASSTTDSPLYALSTGTSRLQYAQNVLDDKLRDIVGFERQLDAKVRPDGKGSIDVSARGVAEGMGGMRRVVRVLEAWREWADAKWHLRKGDEVVEAGKRLGSSSGAGGSASWLLVVVPTRAMAARLAALVPPKIASASAIGAPQTAARNAKIVQFYSALPKGPAPKKQVGLSPFAQYKARYFDGENASAAPFLHAIVGLFLVGYTIDYNMHLKHHKNNHHGG
ncbi:hypothetical protein Rhopal_005898-T1 [Rhodotorula paludigena]|uniref:ATP synthase subunit f, mitochondrial n=1 Tax=Rhodotorula paludigena TaxID=86838 RepID=A0AAV5GW99_9BASI|nr:hypothetical protein Rhopal_005898-T1 [Rhodotorula paludigena]